MIVNMEISENKYRIVCGILVICFLAAVSYDILKIHSRLNDRLPNRNKSAGAENNPCPENSELVLDKKCFYFSHDFVPYMTAIKKCNQRGGLLYEPKDRIVHAIVKEIAREKFPTNSYGYGPWIGVNDITIENRWVYASNEIKVLFEDFIYNQPDNGDLPGNEQNCVHFYQKVKGLWGWNDIQCNSELAYICELPKNKS